MKLQLKHFLIVLCTIITIPLQSRAQSKDTLTKTQVYNDVKLAIKNVSPKVSDAIESLAKQLKVTSNQVWDILVKQQKVWSIGYLVGEIISIWCWCHFWYRIKLGNDNNWKGDAYSLSCWITFIMGIFFSVVSIIHFNDMLTGFFNPEYGAMKTIVEVTNNLKGG